MQKFWSKGRLLMCAALLLACAALHAQSAGAQPAPQQGDPQAWAKAFAAAKARQGQNPPPAQGSLAPSGHASGFLKPSPAVPMGGNPAPTPAVEGPPTLASKPAQPASVTYANGNLTVKADNSDLADILREAAKRSGMTIDGNPPTGRVFGDFGPAPAAAVISKLLDGSSVNYAILGAGRPGAKLVLTAASHAPAAGAGFQPQQPQQQNNGDDDDDPDAAPPQPMPFRPVPQAQNNDNNNGNNGNVPSVRTPQQILQEMQQRRQQQQQNENQNQD